MEFDWKKEWRVEEGKKEEKSDEAIG